ncbi:MAG: hypothetical protein JSU06_08530 [Actinobacteria bacterium]|nr:hypothetical protein [Actinomycetota bacterium]
MLIIRKPLGLGLVIGLLAMAFAALPAIASAAPQLTDPKGSVAVGTTITGTSTNAVTKLGTEELVCKHVEVHGKVKANTGSLVEVEMDGANDKAKECTFGGSSTEVKPTLTSITLTPTEKTAVFDFEVLTAKGFVTATSSSTVTYTSGASSVHVEGPVTGGVSGTFSGDFALSDANGVVKVD